MKDNNILKEINNTIVDLWLKYNNNNCRYTTFITLYYFIFSNFIDLLNGKEFTDLKELNSLILKLVDNVNESNYNKIVEFLQTKKYDSNNSIIDKILKEKDNNNHDILLKQLYVNKNVDYNSTGYICQLFRIFNNMKEFCIIEKKIDSCILCHKTYETIIKPYHHFFEINED